MHFATVLLHHASSDSAGRPPAALRRTVTSSCHMQNLQAPAAEQLLGFVHRNERRCRVVLLNTNVTPQAPQRAYTAVDFRAACEPVPFSKSKYPRSHFFGAQRHCYRVFFVCLYRLPHIRISFDIGYLLFFFESSFIVQLVVMAEPGPADPAADRKPAVLIIGGLGTAYLYSRWEPSLGAFKGVADGL